RLLARDFAKVFLFWCILIFAAIPYLIWFQLNHASVSQMLSMNAETVASEGSVLSLWLKKLEMYLVNCIRTNTIPISILFVLSLFNFPAQRKLVLPASTLPAFFWLCTLGWGSRDVRYVLPVLGYVALSVAALLVRLWRTGKPLLKLSDVALGLYLLMIY